MPIETFSDFTTKALPLTGDFLVGFDSTAEIKTTIASIAQAIASIIPVIPTGTIITHAAQTAPTGFLPCDGRQLSRTTYANLFNVIGTTYGSNPGYFNVPDLRGYFVRGWDNGAGIDIIDGTYVQSARNVTITTNTPHGLTTGNVVTVQYTSGSGVSGTFSISVIDAYNFSYTAVASQTASGNVILPGLSHPFGQTEKDGIKNHSHSITDPGHTHNIFNQTSEGPQWIAFSRPDLNPSVGSDSTGYASAVNGNDRIFNIVANQTGITINSSGTANETRPKNIALLYCIKY